MSGRLLPGSPQACEIVRYYRAGFSLGEISALTGRPRSTLRDCLRREGVQPRRKGGGGQRISNDYYDMVVGLYVREGLSINEIAEVTGRNYRSIHRMLDYAGVPRRDRADAIRLRFARRGKAPSRKVA